MGDKLTEADGAELDRRVADYMSSIKPPCVTRVVVSDPGAPPVAAHGSRVVFSVPQSRAPMTHQEWAEVVALAAFLWMIELVRAAAGARWAAKIDLLLAAPFGLLMRGETLLLTELRNQLVAQPGLELRWNYKALIDVRLEERGRRRRSRG